MMSIDLRNVPDVPSSRPIGVFDSGVGGLSIVQAIRTHLPDESILYLADSYNCPYGARAADEIRALSVGMTRYLAEAGCKLVVVACNTVAAVALDYLRYTFRELPFVGIVPPVKPAAQLTHTGVIGVLATPNTLSGQLYHDVVEHFASGAQVVSQTCPDLVGYVEAGELDSPRVRATLRECLEPLLRAGADTIVLGCTHYPFLTPAIRAVVGEGVQLIEPSEAIARRVGNLLTLEQLVNESRAVGRLVCATTGDLAHFRRQIDQLVGGCDAVRQLTWMEAGLLAA